MTMRFNAVLSLLSLLLISQTIFSQGEIEALRFSRMNPVGSARIVGMAGAGSTLGADLSAAMMNPAALAQLRRGELIISPGFNMNRVEGDYIGRTTSRNSSLLELNNLGVAFVSPRYTGYGRNRKLADRGLIQTTVALGYQKSATYKREARATSYNPYSSITDAYAESANGNFPENLNLFNFSGLAWETFGIDLLANREDQYFGAGVGGELEQRIRLRELGNRSTFYASAGLNFDNTIYVGATLMGLSMNHSYRWQFVEEDINDLHNFFENDPNSAFPLESPTNSLVVRDSVETTGNGITGKLGVVVKANDALRVGVSFQLPGILLNNEVYRREMQHNLTFSDQFGQDSIGVLAAASPEAEGSYNMTTPYGFTIGGTYLFGKQGFVTADLEVVDYSSARLRSPYLEDDPFYYSYAAENDRIASFYQPAVNLRVGCEYRAGMIRARAGAGYEGSPLTAEARTYENPNAPGETLIADLSGLSFAAGLGVRGESAFMDFAIQHRRTKDKQSPYATSAATGFDPTLLSTQATNQIMLTLGVKW